MTRMYTAVVLWAFCWVKVAQSSKRPVNFRFFSFFFRTNQPLTGVFLLVRIKLGFFSDWDHYYNLHHNFTPQWTLPLSETFSWSYLLRWFYFKCSLRREVAEHTQAVACFFFNPMEGIIWDSETKSFALYSFTAGLHLQSIIVNKALHLGQCNVRSKNWT